MSIARESIVLIRLRSGEDSMMEKLCEFNKEKLPPDNCTPVASAFCIVNNVTFVTDTSNTLLKTSCNIPIFISRLH